MKLLIDVQSLQSHGSSKRGIGRYSLNILEKIVATNSNNQIIFLINDLFEFPDRLKELSKNSYPEVIFSHWSPPRDCGYLVSSREYRAIAQRIYESIIKKIAPDVLLILSPFEGLVDNIVWSINDRVPTVSIFYDAIPKIFEKEYLSDKNVKHWYEENMRLLQQCEGLISISENSKKDALDVLKLQTSKHITVEAGLEERTIKLAKGAIPMKHESGPYLFSILGEDFRKNKRNLLNAFQILVQSENFKHNLLIAYKQTKHEIEANFILLKELNLEGRVIFLGYLPDDELFSYLAGAELFVFPSLYEGLGLPVLEAWACSTPVVASNSSSLKELFDTDLFLFDPSDPKSIAEVMLKVLKSDELKRKNVVESHSSILNHQSSDSGEVIWNFLEKLTDNPLHDERQNSPSELLRLAFFSPLPPQKSGISSHAIELIPSLSKNFSLKIFTEHYSAILNEPGSVYSQLVHPISEFNSDDFDVCLYNMGNSDFHIESARILDKNPGIVILHDAYLSGLVWISTTHSDDQSEFPKKLYEVGGSIALSSFLLGDPIEKIINSFMLNSFVIEKASSIVVHSQYSKELIRRDFESLNDEVINVLPQQHQVLAGSGITENFESKNCSFATFGAIGETKLYSKLLEAWKGSLAEIGGKASLYFVGEDLTADIKFRIRELNLEDSVVITGYLSAQEYDKYLHLADVGIQLRKSSRGETSRALLDLMGAGKPVIANANGSFSEFHDYGVLMLKDEFEVVELRESIDNLYLDRNLQLTLGKLNLSKLSNFHSVKNYTDDLIRLIKRGHRASLEFPESITRQISNYAKKSRVALDDQQLVDTLDSIIHNFPHNLQKKRILVDISQFLDFMPDDKEALEVQRIFREFTEFLPFLDVRFVGKGLGQFDYVDIPNFMNKFFNMDTSRFPTTELTSAELATAYWPFMDGETLKSHKTIGQLMAELKKVLFEEYLNE